VRLPSHNAVFSGCQVPIDDSFHAGDRLRVLDLDRWADLIEEERTGV
jgi:hypothetical protein